ncbi:MAG: hypothetical protein HXY30_05485 [Pseudorhodoplanes sp.]|nr:hypothetical protein [Pseudorhodoplanes sp.]
MRSTLLAVAAFAVLATVATSHAQPAKTGCDLPNADRTVHGVTLGDAKSALAVLGDDHRNVVNDRQTDFPWILFASRDNKQILAFRHHAGDIIDSYLEVEVKYGRDDRSPPKLNVFEFVTGNGIKLGMKRRPFLRRMGPCFTSSVNGKTEIIRYEIAEKEPKAPILKAANMPQYYAEYEFDHGVLVRMKFGYAPF